MYFLWAGCGRVLHIKYPIQLIQPDFFLQMNDE